MELTVNGETMRFEGAPHLGALVDSYGLNREGIVVEINGDIPGRDQWDRFALTAGDRVEIVRFMGGG